MSWNLQYKGLHEFIEDTPMYPLDAQSQTEHVMEQVKVAREAASGIIESGVIGAVAGHDFQINISGHANPNHEPATGWANDSIYLSLSQRSPEAS